MLQKLYILHDSKSESYTPPTTHPARGQALRSFGDAVNEVGNPNNMLAKHPGDFTLFEIGDFDLATGAINLHSPKVSIANGLDVKVDRTV